MRKLTARRVQVEARPGIYGDGGGLYLCVPAGGSKSWIYRYQRGGRRRELGLGGLAAVSLAEAREAAIEARRIVQAGGDPIAARQAARAERARAEAAAAKVATFREAAERYIASHEAGWRNPKHRQQWRNTLASYAHPIIGDLPVEAIDTDLVLRVLEPIWAAKPETASRVRGRIELVLNWAKARGLRAGENPAMWRGHLDNLLPRPRKVRRPVHLAGLPYLELPGFMAGLRRQESVGARALEFAILTAAPTGEALGARWDEIDMAGRIWVIPADRMKAGREHRVPLSAAAMAVLAAMAALRHSNFVFPGAVAGRPLSDMALLMTLRRMGRGDLTVHGFRSTFRDWAAERTNFPGEVAEMALAHAVGDRVEAAYRRGDLFEKRRALAEAWGAFCAAPAAAGQVVAINARRGRRGRPAGHRARGNSDGRRRSEKKPR